MVFRLKHAYYLMILFLLLFSPPSMADEAVVFSEDLQAIDQAAASVVRLEVYNDLDAKIGTGSGFAFGEPAVLVTAEHVLKDAQYLIAVRDDTTTFRIDHFIAADQDADISICELPDEAALQPLSTASSAPMRGARVVVIGSQFGLTNLVSMGNVSGFWQTAELDWVLFTAPVSSGCSGAPLIDEEGKVIGIVTGTYDKAQNLNLAAPVSQLISLINTSSTNQ